MILALGSGVLLAQGTASAATYTDTANDAFEGAGAPHLEITSVDVTNDASNLTFRVNLAGNPQTTNWGKYLIGFDTVAGGITSGNPWFRPILMSSGMDYFIGSWVDFGTGWEIYHDTGGTWTREHATYDAVNPLAPSVVTSSSVSFTMPLAYLNLADGDTFSFDVWTAGTRASDSANDASANPGQSITAWNQPYDSGTNLSSFTVVVPEPASLGLLALAAGAVASRRRK